MTQTDKEEYRGYSINFDITQNLDTGLWKVKAAIVSPPLNDSGIPQVHAVPEWDDPPTEDEARDYMMREAKKWIDENPLDETSLYRQ